MNYTFSDEDKQALENGTAVIRCKLIVKAEGELPEIILTEKDSIKDWIYSDDRYVPQQGFIGQFVARTLEGNLQNISDDFSIENREIELQLGVVIIGEIFTYITTENGVVILTESGKELILEEVSINNTTWYSYGNFIVTNPEDNDVADNTKFEAMDYTKLFNKTFDADYTDETFTQSFNSKISEIDALKNEDQTVPDELKITAIWLAKYTCAQVREINKIHFPQESFTNSDFMFDFNPFQNNESCRDVMKAIGQLAYSWVRIDWDNNCYIDFGETVTFADDPYNIIDNNQYYTLETKKQIYGPINAVYIGMSNVDGESLLAADDKQSIADNGEHAIYIYDNPLTYTPELRDAAKAGANKLIGLTYNQLSTETVGHPWLKGNELIHILDMNNNDLPTYPFNKTINYSGHIKSTLDSMGETEVESTLSYTSDVVKNAKNAMILVEKQEGRITELATNISTVQTDLQDNYYTKESTNKTINDAITGWTNTYTSAGGNNRLRNTGLYFTEGSGFEYWEGVCKKIVDINAISQTALSLQANDFEQVVSGLPNNQYTVSFKYEQLISSANVSVIINEQEYTLSEDENEFAENITVSANYLDIIFRCNVNDGFKIYDLMCNVGLEALVWTQHPDEISTDTVNISKGITINSSSIDTTFKANADGIRIVNSQNDATTEFTDTGMITNTGTIKGKASVTQVSFRRVGNQTWLSGE